jgi:hypothetical protein
MYVLAAIAAAIGLAACAGLRIALPLFAIGVAGRLVDWPLAGSLGWLASNPALAFLGVVALVEIVADKVPATHRLIETTQTILAPVAAYLAGLSPLVAVRIPLLLAVAGALFLGLAVGGGIHILAASARIASRRTPGGLGSPFLSVAEDLFASSAALFAIAAPLLAPAAVLVPTVLWVRRLRRDADRTDRAREGVLVKGDAR